MVRHLCPANPVKCIFYMETVKSGKIQVQTENIFPIIKKFLYSDHEIFLRELVSNAVDAVQKLKILSSTGEFKGEIADASVRITINPEAKTLTISDSGLGMTADEVEKYLNQVAFSGAREFLDKYQGQTENSIIGNFGLGFYSAFMVSRLVEVVTRSWQSETAVKWICDGQPEYTLEPAERAERGTDIILHLADDSLEFLDENRIDGILKKYGKFLPVPVFFKEAQINETHPAWKKKPSELQEDEYKNFYHSLYPASFQEPLFHIHLNVDFPFNLTGILYFPKIGKGFEPNREKIQLYSNQVFITDSVEDIVPEYLTLLHGVIDSPDIPLNVSRSYLQADGNVKKLSSHITKKVADKLAELCKNDRADYEGKWNDIQLFVKYGIVTDEKFAEKSVAFTLFEDTDGKKYNWEEFKTTIEPLQKDKDGKLICLYTHHPETHARAIQQAKERGYVVIQLNTPIEAHFISRWESSYPEVKFTRMDAAPLDQLIDTGEEIPSKLSEEEATRVQALFQQALGENHFTLKTAALSETDLPVCITEAEFMRRMSEMNYMAGADGFKFYEFTINKNHPIIHQLVEQPDENKVNLLIDLAKLEKGLLSGDALARYIQRTVDTLQE